MPFVSSGPVNLLIPSSSTAGYQFAVGSPYDTECQYFYFSPTSPELYTPLPGSEQ